MSKLENDGKVITITYKGYGDEDRNLGDLMDWLSDKANIIQANELYQFACIDGNGKIFDFTNKDELILAREGSVKLEYTGETIEDYKVSNPDFYKWYY